jgi:broad specificity phosphatase PhoE
MTQPLKIFYVRHGETEWSLSGQHTGTTDIPLTAKGEDDARALAPWMRNYHFDHVYTSPRQRARRTCELAGLGETVTVEPDLSEWNYGEYEGIRTVDIRKQRPDWDIWTQGCPGGESPSDITARVDRLLGRLKAQGGNVALFAHGHIGLSLGTRWCELELTHGRVFTLRPASLSILGHEARAPDAPVILLWNATPVMPA